MTHEHTQMIRRTEVRLTREPRMPFATLRCPYCGTSENVQAAGERECAKCAAPLTLVMPRNR